MSRANEPAFPGENAMRFGQTNDCNPGMTLREHFAGLAMQGFAANSELSAKLARQQPETVAQVYAVAAVLAADALIAELEKAK
jgi:hypothetical protein